MVKLAKCTRRMDPSRSPANPNPRVMIDATSLLLRSGGVKTYTYELIKSLRGIDGARVVRLFPFSRPSGIL